LWLCRAGRLIGGNCAKGLRPLSKWLAREFTTTRGRLSLLLSWPRKKEEIVRCNFASDQHLRFVKPIAFP